MPYGKYFEYTIYSIGSISVLYIFIIVFRHILLFYIIKALQKIAHSLHNKTYNQEEAEATDREDELKRDQEAEIFKEEVKNIKAKLNKQKSGKDAIDVKVQRMGRTSQGTKDTFSGSNSRLQMGQETERIVGVAKPIGKWTKLILGKKMSQIASIMQNQQSSKGHKDGYWTAYIKARNTTENHRFQQRS